MMNLCDAAEILTAKKSGVDAATDRLIAAMERYAEMGTGYRVSDATESALRKIAEENWAAKTALRDILRRHVSWDEGLQETTTEVVVDVPVDWYDLRYNLRNFLRRWADPQNYDLAADAVCVLDGTADPPAWATAAYKALTGHDYRSSRKATRTIREILVACGVWDGSAGSDCQKQYAAWAEAVAKQHETRTLHLSICPAVQLTQSNPHEDGRGPTLVSCHSLDCENYGYSAGNSGYATDAVTMIAYTCSGDDRYTRKTSRQLYMYSNGTLLQSRLYDTNGANDHADDISAAYRAAVQAIIANCLEAPNAWTEPENAAYADCIYINNGFGGYPDFQYTSFGCTVSRLAAWDDYSTLYIGGPGICIGCGAYTWSDCGATCPDCDNAYGYCSWCGDRARAEDLINTDDGPMCDYCLQARDYRQCDCCGQYTHDTYYIAGTDEVLCESCFEAGDYSQCENCMDWYNFDDIEIVKVQNMYWYNDGTEFSVCPHCLESMQAAGNIIEAEED